MQFPRMNSIVYSSPSSKYTSLFRIVLKNNGSVVVDYSLSGDNILHLYGAYLSQESIMTVSKQNHTSVYRGHQQQHNQQYQNQQHQHRSTVDSLAHAHHACNRSTQNTVCLNESVYNV